MGWKSIVAGIDESPESRTAAAAAWELAEQTGARCQLVHVTPHVASMPVVFPASYNIDELMERLTATARETIRRVLEGEVPDPLAAELDVRVGKAGLVLPQAVHDFDADLLVIGGKHHAPPTRWFGGSTAHHLLRVLDTPMLVVAPSYSVIDRVLVAVDLSYAAKEVLQTAARIARENDAKLTALHAIEPMPYLSDYPSMIDHEAFAHWCDERFRSLVNRWCDDVEIDVMAVEGDPLDVVTKKVASVEADLLVVGSHGKGWVDRVLVGSTTTGLLNRLPTSMFIVPVAEPAAGSEDEVDVQSNMESAAQ